MTERDVREVLVVGLGTIARTHLAVLGRRHDLRVAAGVDPEVPGGHPFPVFGDLTEALRRIPHPDLVVVATPTETHPRIVREVLAATDALVLSEKPLARSHAHITELEEAVPDVRERVRVAHHFAFSPEVEWARRTAAAHPHWGRPGRVLSVFNDAYGRLPAERLASYVSTWVDSGPNQLSLLGAFVDGWRLVAHEDQGHRAVTTLEHGDGTGVLTSNWLAADTSKQTTIDYGDGAVQVRMDHTSMTGLVIENGRVVEHMGYVGDLGRKEAHYQGLYDVLLADDCDPRLGVPLATEIARLLEAGERASAGDAVRWSEVPGAERRAITGA